jgi:transcription elongation factor Elf1
VTTAKDADSDRRAELSQRTKTCPKCSQEKSGSEFTISKRGDGHLFLSASCKKCRAATEAKRRERREDHVSKNPDYVFPPYIRPTYDRLSQEEREPFRERMRKYASENQSQSLESATNHYKEWTGPELELLLREDLTAIELAEMLNRTLHSVRRMRVKVQKDPRKQVHAGIDRAEL